MRTPEWSRWKKPLLWSVLIFVSVFVLFYRLPYAPVDSWDEGFYALMAIDAGSVPLMPSLYGQPWIEKPPLGVWILALSFDVLGRNAWALRLPSAVFALVAILLLFDLGQRLFDRKTGFAAAILFATSPVFLAPHMARSGDMDTMLLCAVVALMWSYVRAWKDERFWYGVALASGLGILLRGLPMLLPMTAVGMHTLIFFRSHIPSWKTGLKATVLFLSLTVPWHVAAYLLYGQAFVDGYLKHAIFSRVESVVEGHTGPWHFYDTHYLRWKLGLLAFVGYAGALWGIGRAAKDRDGVWTLLVLWLVIPFAALCVMQTKLYWYVMPVLPVLFLLGAGLIHDLWQKRSGWGSLFGFLLAIGLSYAWLTNEPLNVLQWRDSARLSIWIGIAAGALLVFRKQAFLALTTGLVVIALAQGLVNSWHVVTASYTPPLFEHLAYALSKEVELPTVLYDESLGVLRGNLAPQEAWYLNIHRRLNVGLVDTKSLERWLDDPRMFRVVLPQTNLESLRAFTQRTLRVETTVGPYVLVQISSLR